MKFLIAFGSTEGQTKKIAEWVAARIAESGHEARTYDSNRFLRDLDVASFDAMIVAGSVHQKLHQDSIVGFARAHKAQLDERPATFLSISLNAGLKGHEEECDGYIESFVQACGWQPASTLKVAGALKYSEYDFFMEQIIRHVVLKGEGPADPNEDYELTDWDELGTFVDGFVGQAGA